MLELEGDGVFFSSMYILTLDLLLYLSVHCTIKSIESKFFLFFWKILSFYLSI
jgi:hypothetical protein